MNGFVKLILFPFWFPFWLMKVLFKDVFWGLLIILGISLWD